MIIPPDSHRPPGPRLSQFRLDGPSSYAHNTNERIPLPSLDTLLRQASEAGAAVRWTPERGWEIAGVRGYGGQHSAFGTAFWMDEANE